MPSALRLAGAAVLLAGCPVDEPTDDAPPYSTVCTDPTPVPCVDEMTDTLPLNDGVSPGSAVGVVQGNDWILDVDATAGGLNEAPNNPWVYLKFTDAGADKLDLSDFESLDSMDWHLALHRFKLRLNSGVGGPSCVGAAAFPGAAYDDLGPEDGEGATFLDEAFFDDACVFQEVDFGVEGAPEGVPELAMTDWWTYPDCVAMTGIPFLIRIESGRLLKLEVLRYYGQGQAECDTDGQLGADSALIQLKWAFVH